jgi:hypothetical protein
MLEKILGSQDQKSFKSTLFNFYKKNKTLLISLILSIIIFVFSVIFYLEIKENKKISISEDFIDAKIYIKKNQNEKALGILNNIIRSKDPTYSILSLFLMLDKNLINKNDKKFNLFDTVLDNNNIDEEIKNLVIFKKAIFYSNFTDEKNILELTRPLINTSSIWQPHALQLLGDFFINRNENLKAKEFYLKILSLKNINNQFYEHAKTQLAFITK